MIGHVRTENCPECDEKATPSDDEWWLCMNTNCEIYSGEEE